MCRGVVPEVTRLQQLRFNDVIEAKLSDGHHGGSNRGPVGSVEKLLEPLLLPDLKSANSKLKLPHVKIFLHKEEIVNAFSTPSQILVAHRIRTCTGNLV